MTRTPSMRGAPDDADIAWLLGQAPAPPEPPPGLVDRILAEAAQTPQSAVVLPFAPRRLGRRLWAGVVVSSILGVAAAAAAVNTGAIDVHRLVQAPVALFHKLPHPHFRHHTAKPVAVVAPPRRVHPFAPVDEPRLGPPPFVERPVAPPMLPPRAARIEMRAAERGHAFGRWNGSGRLRHLARHPGQFRRGPLEPRGPALAATAPAPLAAAERPGPRALEAEGARREALERPDRGAWRNERFRAGRLGQGFRRRNGGAGWAGGPGAAAEIERPGQKAEREAGAGGARVAALRERRGGGGLRKGLRPLGRRRGPARLRP